MNRAWTRRTASTASRMSSSECAGESGSESTSSPARSATGSGGCAGIALAEPRQPVHGQEVDARGDQLLAEGTLVGVARRAGARGVDPDDVQVERVRVAVVAVERRDPLEPGEALVVERELPLPDPRVRLDPVELDERDRREDVREVRLEARASPGRRAIRRHAGSAACSGSPSATSSLFVATSPPSPAAMFFVA